MKFLFFFVLLLSSVLVIAEEAQFIKLGEAKTKKSVLAFPPLLYFGTPTTNSKFLGYGKDLYNVILNDLTISAFFQIQPQDYLETTSKTGIKPNEAEPKAFFKSWKAMSTDFLIRGGFMVVGNDIELEIYVYNINKSDLLLGRKYKTTASTIRKMGHTFVNDFIEAMTGSKSMFNSKVVVASDRNGNGFKEIFVMDWDGFNIQKITNHKTISISPNWSSDGKKILYTAFVKRKGAGRNPDMYVYELSSGERYRVSYRQGTNSGGFFTPDGKSILLTISQSGNPDIFKITMDGGVQQRITNGPLGAMNVEPAMDASGKKITFSSDRHGRPMIYTMDTDGSNVKRITFAGQFNSSPSWSPDGKKIAFAGQSDDHFDIFIVDADGTNMSRLTSAKKKNGKWADNEDPAFSPCGRFVMYSSNRTGKSQIYISTIDGTEERQITLDSYNYFKPKWSSNF